jgi:hypothetical protein
MKFIIDLIEDVREQIANHEDYSVTVGLLKKDTEDSTKLIYSGEAFLNTYHIDNQKNKLYFSVENTDKKVTIGELIPNLVILDMKAMMYELSIHVNAKYREMEVIGFGKNDEAMRYILFIKI